MSLTHFERMKRSLAGQRVDHLPVAVWQHFPRADTNVESLIRATLSFQEEFDSDFVKLMPSGMYSVIDYGVETRPGTDARIGNKELGVSPIRSLDDWAALPNPRVDDGALAATLAVIRGVRRDLPDATPLIATLFSPLTMAAKIAGEAQFAALLQDAALATVTLKRLTQDVIAFAEAAVHAGADGFYYATQQATTGGESPTSTYARFGAPFDGAILGDIRDSCEFLLLHVHGKHPAIAVANDLPVDCVSWEDRESDVSMIDGVRMSARAVCGGLDRTGALLTGTPEESARDVRSALTRMPESCAVVAPGCVLLQGTSHENIAAAMAVVRGTAASLQVQP